MFRDSQAFRNPKEAVYVYRHSGAIYNVCSNANADGQAFNVLAIGDLKMFPVFFSVNICEITQTY